jgi:hypothetical protein
MYLKDPKSGLPSPALTAFALGFVVAVAKLLVSGLQVDGFTLSPFTGTDFAAVVGALGAVYWAHSKDDTKPE